MNFVHSILEIDLVLFDFQQLQLSLFFELRSRSATTHAAKRPQHVSSINLFSPLLKRLLLLLQYGLAFLEIFTAAIEISGLEALLSPLFEQLRLTEPVLAQYFDIFLDGSLEMNEVLLCLKDHFVFLVFGVVVVDFLHVFL